METNDKINVGRWVDDRLATLSPSENWKTDTAAGLALLGRGAKAQRARRRRWVWVPVTAGLCICALAFPGTRVLAQWCVKACVAETTRAGEFLWPHASGSGQRINGVAKIGERREAHDFTLPDISGTPVQLSKFRGQVVLLNFWATWCGPCKVEIPWFVEIQRVYRDTGLTILGVSMDEDGLKSVKPYTEEKNDNYRVIVGDDGIARTFGGIESLPTTLIIDKAGRIAVTRRFS